MRLYCKYLQTGTRYRGSENGIANCDHSHTKFGELRSTNGENRTVGLSHWKNFVLPVPFKRGILSGEILSGRILSISRRLH